MRFLKLKERVRECIKFGDFIMSSGQKTDWMCDLLECRDIFPDFMRELGLTTSKYLLGIETGGYLLAREVFDLRIISEKKAYQEISLIRKTGEIYLGKESGIINNGSFTNFLKIIDDVVSTEKTFAAAIEVIHENKIKGDLQFYAVLDRRVKENSTMKVTSLFTPQDFGLES